MFIDNEYITCNTHGELHKTSFTMYINDDDIKEYRCHKCIADICDGLWDDDIDL